MCYGSQDSKDRRLCLNLNDRQYEALKGCSEVLGVSMCQFIRMYLNTLAYGIDTGIGGGNLANEKSDINAH